MWECSSSVSDLISQLCLPPAIKVGKEMSSYRFDDAGGDQVVNLNAKGTNSQPIGPLNDTQQSNPNPNDITWVIPVHQSEHFMASNIGNFIVANR